MRLTCEVSMSINMATETMIRVRQRLIDGQGVQHGLRLQSSNEIKESMQLSTTKPLTLTLTVRSAMKSSSLRSVARRLMGFEGSGYVYHMAMLRAMCMLTLRAV